MNTKTTFIKYLPKLCLLMVFLSFSFVLSAQNALTNNGADNIDGRGCGAYEHMEQLLSDPVYSKLHKGKIKRYEEYSKSQPETRALCANPVILPVAIHFQGIANPDVACLTALAEGQIQILNDDLQGTNADISNWVNTASATFPGIDNGETCLELCIATQSHPEGYGLANGDLAITINQNSTSDEPDWAGYINFFVRDIGGGLLGFSPYGGDGDGDGITMNLGAFGTGPGCPSSGVVPGAPYDLGRTVTHELGHYLLLNHIWSQDNNCAGSCAIDDGVADTPDQESCNFGCPTLGSSSCGSADMHMNYMDYVDDMCMYMFSAGQSTRMEDYVASNLSSVVTNGTVVCAVCDITEVIISNIGCDDNGTPCDVTDDRVTFEIQVNGTGGTSFNFADNTGNVYTGIPGNLSYNTNHSGFVGDVGSAFTGVTITVTDDVDMTCQGTADIAAGTCGDNELPMANCQDATVVLVGGSYTLTSADIDNGSSDNCAIEKMCVSGEIWETSSGTLELSDPTFTFDDSDPNVACFLDQTFGCCDLIDGDHHYDEQTITVPTADTYIFTLNDIAGNTDFAGMIYSAPFDPANPCANLLDGDDENNAQGYLDPLLCMVMDLTPGTYYLVTTTWRTGDDDFPADYTWDIQQGCDAELTCDDVGTLEINLIVKDGNANVETCAATVTVEENDPPTSTCDILEQIITDRCPDGIGGNGIGAIISPDVDGILTFAIGGLPYTADVNCVSDDCSEIQNIGFELVSSELLPTANGDCERTIEQVYNLIDEAGNILADGLTTHTTFIDDEAPTITCAPFNEVINTVCPEDASTNLTVGQTLPNNQSFTVGGVSFPGPGLESCGTDNCTPTADLVWTVEDIIITNTDACNSTLVVQWRVYDACGTPSANTLDCTFTFVDPGNAPTLVCYPFNPQPAGSDINNPVVVGTSEHWTTDGGGTIIASNNLDNCDGEVTFNTPDVEDDCDDTPSLRMKITQNVDTDPSISFDNDVSESEQREEFFPKGLSYVEFFATDACGNESEIGCDFYILVVDDIAPVVESVVPADVMVQCADDPAVTSPPDLEFSDNCDANPNLPDYTPIVVSATSETTPGTCVNNFVIVHTWTYEQMCDDDNDPSTEPLTTTVSQTVTVNDDTAPVWDYDDQFDFEYSTEAGDQCPSDANISLSEGDVIGAFDTWTIGNEEIAALSGAISDNCTEDADMVITVTEITDNMDGCDRLITISFSAMDECGNVTAAPDFQCSYRFVDDTAPVIACPADVVVACDASTAPEIMIEGFTDIFAPANWTINLNGGGGSVDVSGAPTDISLTSSDNGNSGNTEFCITVPADGAIAFDWSYTTNDANATWDAFGYSVDGTFVQLTADISAPQSGSTMVMLSAGQEFCFDQQTFDGFFGSAATISDMFVYEAEPTGVATATDNCNAPVVTFIDVITPSSICDATYTITRTWTADDGCGNTSSCDQIIEVVDDIAPVISCPADAEVSCEDDNTSTATGVATAEDNCSEFEITESDASTQGVDPAECDFYSYEITRTWTATDACGNESSCDQTITVSDVDEPVWDFDCQIAATFTTQGGSDCPDDAEISLNIGDEISVFDGWTVAGIDILPLQGCVADACAAEEFLIIRVVDKTKTSDGCTALLTITFEAEDPCGNIAGGFTCNYTITDDTAPVITAGTAPQGQELTATGTGCTQIGYIWLPFATDNCQTLDFNNVSISAVPYVNFSPITPGANPNGGFPFYWFGQFEEGPTVVTITVDDGCGNEVSITHTITVIDTEPPFIKTPCPDDVVLSTEPGVCDAEYTFTNPEYDDFCLCAEMEVCFTSDDIDPALLPENVTYVGTSGFLQDITATFPKGTTTVTFKVSDPSGNVNADCSFDITVEDNEPPTFADQTDYCFFTEEDGAACPGTAILDLTVDDFDFDDSFTAGGISVDGPSSADFADNCPEMFLEILSIDEVLTTCNITWTIVWQVTDCGGNTVTQDQVVEIKDNTAPMITCPADIAVECDASTDPVGDPSSGETGTGEATAVDQCTDVTVSYSDVSTQGSDPEACDFYNYTITRTWTAEDECGNASSCDQIITVEDTQGPEITCPADLEVQCDASTEPADTGMATAEDNCSGVEITYNDVVTDGDCPQEMTITRTWTATDVCGNATTCDQIIEVVDTEAPVIDPAAEDMTVECDGAGNIADLAAWLANNGGASAIDNCGEVTWTYAPDPAVLSDDCGATGSVEVTFTATDECGNSDETTATFTIEDTVAPDGDDPAGETDVNVCKDEASAALPMANDIAAIELAYSDACSEFTVTFAEESCGVDDDDCAWTLTRIYDVIDDCGNATTSTIIHTGGDTSPPEFITTPDNQGVDIIGTDCSQSAHIWVPEYTDNCTDMNLTHVSISADPFVNFGPIQQDAVTGNYFWTGTFEAGTTVVSITITDDCDLSTTDVHTVEIIDNIPPFISLSECPSDVELDTDDGVCETTYSWQNPSYQDNCQCNRMEICFSSDDAAFIPDMITYQEASGNAAIVGPLAFAKGTTTVCYKVYDDSDNLNDECCFEVVVLDDEFPTVTEILAGDTFECVSELPAPDVELVTDEADNCPDPVVEFVEDVYSDNTGCNDSPLEITRTYSVTDCGGNVVNVTQIFVIQDLTAPTASDGLAITVDCDSDVPAPDPEVITDEADNCGGDVTVTYTGESSTGGTGCGDPLIITRDYLVEDCGGLSIPVNHVITVDDQTAPLAVCQNIEVSLDENGEASIVAADVDGGSSDACGEVSLSIDITDFSCADWGTPVEVTLTVEDENCNTSTCTAMVTVLDEEAPVAVCPAATIELFLDENGEATLAADAAGDGSSTDNCSVTETNPEVLVTCDDISIDGVTSVTVDITATDACGLTSTVTCDVFVFDNLPPVATECQDDIIDNGLTGLCFNTIDWPYPVFADNCDGALPPADETNLTVTTSDETINVDFESTSLEAEFPVGTTTVTMCMTDSNGNEGCCSFDVTILDPAPPMADFTITVEGLEVCAEDMSMNADSYTWDTGDGTWYHESYFCHTYEEPGTYTICLTVESVCGEEDVFCQDVTVEPEMAVELTPIFFIEGTTFAQNQCREAVYIINNLELSPTNGMVQILISAPSAFSMTIDPNATIANVAGGIPADNTHWVITPLGPNFLLTMPLPDQIPGSGTTVIAVNICADGLPSSTGQTTGTLINYTGGDVDLNNNYAQGSLIIN